MKQKRTKLNTRGMTLTEVLVSITILTLVSLTMVTGFLAAGAFIRRGADLKRAGESLAATAEAEAIARGGASQGVVFGAGGHAISGQFVQVVDDRTGTTFTLFVADQDA